MNTAEQFEFDRAGYIVIKQMLTPNEVATLSNAADALEEHARTRIDVQRRQPMNSTSIETRFDEEGGYFAYGEAGDGNQLVVEDFWNANPVFDLLLDHPRTRDYIDQAVIGRHTINNSELRIRYPGNATGTHMGGPINTKYRYSFSNGRIDAMMVRMIYFLHDVGPDQGPFSVMPGTHKSNFPIPYEQGGVPDDEPGMIGLPVQAGDAILFTENLRHGGLTNRSRQTRKTLHVGYGPNWLLSQNLSTMDEPQNLSETTRARLTRAQLDLFSVWVSGQKLNVLLQDHADEPAKLAEMQMEA